MPKRQPGLWEVAVASGSHKTPYVSKQCLDEATDAKLMQMGSEMSAKIGGQCQRQEIKKEGGVYKSSSVCNMGPTTITSQATFSGDFWESYQGDIHATFNPPLMGKSESDTKIVGKWLGPCEAGQKPGDIIMPGGMTWNVNNPPDLGAMIGRFKK